MYSDEGPSRRPHFPKTQSQYVELEAVELCSQQEDNVPQETADPERRYADAPTSLKSRPLTLFDDYDIVGGVPTFVFRPEDDLQWSHRPFGLSSDGSLMALAGASTTLCVYDLLDGCSLVARKEGICSKKVLFLSFWNDRNDELVVVAEDGTVTFFSLLEDLSTSNEPSTPNSSPLRELKEGQLHKLDDDFDLGKDCAFDVFTFGPTLWIAHGSKRYPYSTHLTRITKEECRQVKLHFPEFSFVSLYRIRVGKDVLSIQDLNSNRSLNKSYIFNEINLQNVVVRTDPVVVHGTCIALNGFGQYVLVWKSDTNGQNHLNLYSKDLSHLDVSRPIACLELGKDVLSAEVKALDRQAWTPDENKDRIPHQLPLLCIFINNRSRADILVWDADWNKVITRINVTMKEGEYVMSELTVSPNGKWLAILDIFSSLISMFSLVSGVQVWQTCLDACGYDQNQRVLMTFDALSTKLVVNWSSKVYVFVLPCLIEEYKIDFKVVDAKIDFTNDLNFGEDVISVIREDQMLVTSSSALASRTMLDLFLRSVDVEHAFHRFVRVANSFFTSQIAIMIHNEKCFSIIRASLEEIYSSKFVNLVSNLVEGCVEEHGFHEVKIEKDMAKAFKSPHEIECIVSYPNKRKNEDCLAILGSDVERTSAIFINIGTSTRELVHFESGMVYVYVQSKDRARVTCLKEYSVLVIDLEKKQIAREVQYRINLLHWIYTYHRERHSTKHMPVDVLSRANIMLGRAELSDGYLEKAKHLVPPQIAKDGITVLLGWSMKDGKPILLTPQTSNQDLMEATSHDQNVMPCWSLDDSFQRFLFIEMDQRWRYLKSVGTYTSKDNKRKNFCRDGWTPRTARFLDGINFSRVESYYMAHNEKDGCTKTLVFISEDTLKYKALIVPMTPYSMNTCLPCLHNLDYSVGTFRVRDVDWFVSNYGASFLNMPFNGKTNLHVAIEHGDVDMVRALIDSAHSNNVLLGTSCSQNNLNDCTCNLLEVATQQNSEDVVKAFLDVFKRQQVPLIYGSKTILGAFQSLWTSNRMVSEELLLDNLLCWDMSTLDVPRDILTNKAFVSARAQTIEDIQSHRRREDGDIISNDWRTSNKQLVEEICVRTGDTKVKAIAKVFCFENICKIGSKGILRFLLSQQAPASLYKAPLIKWIVLYKWEHIWKKRSLYKLIQYGVMLGMFTSYVICIGLDGNRLKNDLFYKVCTTLVLLINVLLVMAMLCEEVMQLKTYITDGSELLRKGRSWGIKHYLGSFWNIIELSTYLILFFLIVPMHILSFLYAWHFPFFYVLLAIESILMWFKVWYFAQAFTRTGALVLLIENVVRDCIPFLLLSGLVLIGFSIGLFAMFQDIIVALDSADRDVNDDQSENETLEKIFDSFGSLPKAMLTLFYAMIGTFDVEVYSKSGGLSPIIVLFFVLYLSIQAIVMFNMLIAVMNDTFANVKSTKEEQLLMGRARFIDACEASLSENQIKRLKSKTSSIDIFNCGSSAEIGRYLYVLFPTGELDEENITWQGRINAIRDSSRRDLNEAQAAIMEKMKRLGKRIRSLNKRTKNTNARTLTSLEENLECKMREEIRAMEERTEQRIKDLGASLLEQLKTLIDTSQSEQLLKHYIKNGTC